jgi:hypothetical protein
LTIREKFIDFDTVFTVLLTSTTQYDIQVEGACDDSEMQTLVDCIESSDSLDSLICSIEDSGRLLTSSSVSGIELINGFDILGIRAVERFPCNETKSVTKPVCHSLRSSII